MLDFDIVWHAVQSVLTLCILGGVGYVLARAGWFSPDAKALLPRLVTLISLPPYMLYNITNTFTREQLIDFAYGAAVPVLSITFTFCLSLLIGRLIKVRKKRRGLFYSGFTASNTIFIGLPVNLALFGEQALPYVLLYYFANSAFFWSVGNSLIAADGENVQEKICSIATLKRVLSPPTLAFLLGIAMLLVDVRLPPFLNNAARYLGNMTTPLILLFLGVMLQSVRFRGIRLDRELAFILLGRFVISPLSIVCISSLIPLPELMRQVFIIQSSLPAVASLSLLASFYDTDPEFGTVAVSTTTLLSIVTIPVMMILVTH